MVAESADGADGLAAVVLEQPDVLVLEARLPSLPGIDVVRTVHELAPRTLVAVQAESSAEVERLLDAGAAAVFSPTVPPAAVCQDVAERFRTSMSGAPQRD